MYSSFILIIISVIFSFFFQFLDSPSEKFTMSDFHQEVILSNILPPPAVHVFVCKLFVYLSVCFLVFRLLQN